MANRVRLGHGIEKREYGRAREINRITCSTKVQEIWGIRGGFDIEYLV